MAKPQTKNDATFTMQLLQQIAKGDQRAFGQLVYGHAPHLAGYVYRMCGSKEVAEEITQDVFALIWAKRSTLNEIRSLDNYLFILSKNRVLNHLRQQAQARNRQLQWSSQYEEEFDSITAFHEKEELSLLIDEAVKKLPPQQKMVYTLSREEKLKHEEIADRLGLSKETVKKHMKLALSFLKTNLKSRIEQALCYLVLAYHLVF